MKIYTKAGDKGKTTLIGGKRVAKNHIRIEAYGAVDELTAFIGLIKDMNTDVQQNGWLLKIQDNLMTCAAILAADCDDCTTRIPELKKDDVTALEKIIDTLQETLPELKSFVLPGGHPLSSQCQIARTVCRRAERQITGLASELFVPDTVLQYINRLSDFLFVLARKVLRDNNKKDILWIPGL